MKYFIPAIVLVVVVAGAASFYLMKANASLSSEEVGQLIIEFINDNDLAGGAEASLIEVIDEGSIYKVRLSIADTDFDSYATKDGKIFFPQGYELTEEEEPVAEEKRDRPDVKLFVMSYCPYGLQAQKMYLPVYDLLKDSADMGIYFVNYIMHDKEEIDENLNQYCIQKEQKDKYADYLNCFTVSGGGEACLAEAGVNTGQMDNCYFETDKQYSVTTLYNDKSTWLNGYYPLFNVHADLNEKYAVQGSPTVVINDKVVQVNPRSPENFKNLICASFNNPPEACSQVLSEEVPVPSFGEGTGGSSGGDCQ